MNGPHSRVAEVARLQEEVGEGRCPFCERPLSHKQHGRKRFMCFRADCVVEYHRIYSQTPSRKRYNYLRNRRVYEANLARGLTARGTPRKLRAYRRKPR